jgi:hypothetical protein
MREGGVFWPNKSLKLTRFNDMLDTLNRTISKIVTLCWEQWVFVKQYIIEIETKRHIKSQLYIAFVNMYSNYVQN